MGRHKKLLTKDDAKKLGITDDERLDYNADVLRELNKMGYSVAQINEMMGINAYRLIKRKSNPIDFETRKLVMPMLRAGYSRSDICRLLSLSPSQYRAALNRYSKHTVKKALENNKKHDRQEVYRIARCFNSGWGVSETSLHLGISKDKIKKLQKEYSGMFDRLNDREDKKNA